MSLSFHGTCISEAYSTLVFMKNCTVKSTESQKAYFFVPYNRRLLDASRHYHEESDISPNEDVLHHADV